MNNQIIILLATIAVIAIGAIDQKVNGATIEDIKSELTYSKISNMGLDSTVDTINLNVNNEFYAEYQNTYNNSFIFVELKPIMGIQTIATNQPYAIQKPIPVNSEIEELKNEIEELKEDRNNDNNDDNNNNDDNKDDNNDSKDETDITKSDPRFSDKYDSIDWMDGEDESKNMSIEDMDEHLKEQENENQEDNNNKEQD